VYGPHIGTDPRTLFSCAKKRELGKKGINARLDTETCIRKQPEIQMHVLMYTKARYATQQTLILLSFKASLLALLATMVASSLGGGLTTTYSLQHAMSMIFVTHAISKLTGSLPTSHTAITRSNPEWSRSVIPIGQETHLAYLGVYLRLMPIIWQ
jgi:hypothetical protein